MKHPNVYICTKCKHFPAAKSVDFCHPCMDAMYNPRYEADARVAARSAARMGER